MAIKLGNNTISLKVGSADVGAVYLGSTLVYSGGTPPTPPTPSFDGKWLATYTGGTTSSAECDASSAITQNEISKTDLVAVEIGQCVTSIGAYVFKNCRSLTSVTIPDSVTSISDYAFNMCSSLTSVTIPNSVTNIGEGAFGDCSSLTSAIIGNGARSISDDAFNMCSSLTSITCLSIVPPALGSGVFNDTASNLVIYVPQESLSYYQSEWADYSSRIQPF